MRHSEWLSERFGGRYVLELDCTGLKVKCKKVKPRRLYGVALYERNKGKRGEREVATKFTELALPARRSQQYCGTPESGDVTFKQKELGSMTSVEVKNYEKYSSADIAKWMTKARRDAGPERMPMLCAKQSRGQWYATLHIEDLAVLLHAWRKDGCKTLDDYKRELLG